jgi:hypothetical protein
MMPIDWGWLAVTFVQVLGLSMALATLGFAYEGAQRGRRPLMAVVAQSRYLAWLAASAILLAGGMIFSAASPMQKGAAAGLAICLAWLTWQNK